MKIKPFQADGFAAKPPETIRAVLVFGPDTGLIRERSNQLCKSVLDDLTDPFRFIELTDADLKHDPARLADEAAAISMMGGRRVVRVTSATDTLSSLLKSFLDNPVGDALIVVEAGELTPRSRLRKLFEEANTAAAALPCYADDAAALEQVITTTLAREGLAPEPDALAFLSSQLGRDRGVTMRELEKLCLYMGPAADGRKRALTLADARASVGDNAADGLNALIDAASSGDLPALDAELARAREADVNAIVILGALTRHLSQLHLILSRVERGADGGSVIKSLRPPVHFSRQPALKRQLRLWTRRRAQQALSLLADAQADCKTTGLPAVAICNQALMRVGAAARSARGSLQKSGAG